MAGDEVGDHFHRNRNKLPIPRIKDAAPDCLVDGNGFLMLIIDFAAVDLGIADEHPLELTDCGGNHSAVMPGRGLHSFSAKAL